MFWSGIMGRDLVGPFRVPEGVTMNSAKYIEFLTDHFLPWYKKKKQNHLHAWQCTMSCCKEYLCLIGCHGHKRRETYCVATILPLTSTLLRTFRASSSNGSMRSEVVHIKTAALESCSDTLQRNSSRNFPKTHKFNGYKNCEDYIYLFYLIIDFAGTMHTNQQPNCKWARVSLREFQRTWNWLKWVNKQTVTYRQNQFTYKQEYTCSTSTYITRRHMTYIKT